MYDIKKIKQILKDKKITYDKLSQMCNIPKSTIMKVLSENTKNPRVDTINAILNALKYNEDPTPDYPLLIALSEAGIEAQDIANLTDEQTALIKGLIANFLKNKNKK